MAYVGFNKLQSQLASRPGVSNPGALAAAIGRNKYGAQRMAAAAKSGHSLRGAKVTRRRKKIRPTVAAPNFNADYRDKQGRPKPRSVF